MDNSTNQTIDRSLTEEELSRLRRGRLARLREEMRMRDIAALVLLDPVNVRYATDARNMQVFMLRNPARYLFLPLEGPVIIFEFEGCYHLVAGLETVDEVRPATTVSFVASGTRVQEAARHWVREIADLLRTYCGEGVRVGLERVNSRVAFSLARRGYTIVDAQEPVERARARKLPEELLCIRASLAATEEAVARLRGGIRPGATENDVWSLLHQAVIARDGDYIETRLLSSGPRTKPWFQECSAREMRSGDLVALDTDVIGRYGYDADFSRTFYCGTGRPTDEQKLLYNLAVEQVHTNMALIKPGVTFRELAQKAWPIPDDYSGHRYFVLAHGIGMTGEYPYIYHLRDFDAHGYDGLIEEGMTLCLESYIAAEHGVEGVKFEEQVLVTRDGVELLSHFPYEDVLLA
jgi:Xaa-Pro aminopeptidase